MSSVRRTLGKIEVASERDHCRAAVARDLDAPAFPHFVPTPASLAKSVPEPDHPKQRGRSNLPRHHTQQHPTDHVELPSLDRPALLPPLEVPQPLASLRRRVDECIERRQRLDEVAATIAPLRATLFDSAPRPRARVHPRPLPPRSEPSEWTHDADGLPA
jgi:hypothetical protein